MCNPPQKRSCDERQQVEFYWKQLPRYYCVQPDSYGRIGLNTEIAFPPFLPQSDVSDFQQHVIVRTPLHEASPHMAAVFTGHNHGSWIDFQISLLPRVAAATSNSSQYILVDVPNVFEHIERYFSFLMHVEGNAEKEFDVEVLTFFPHWTQH